MTLSGKMKIIREFFFSNYESNEFGYVLYPFLRIFKVFGFVPIKMQNGKLFKTSTPFCRHKIKWDWRAIVIGLLGAIGLTVGFGVAVNNLPHVKHWPKVRDAALIAFLTNWTQILAIFLQAIMALFTSWTSMPKMQCLCYAIHHIDKQLDDLTHETISYKGMRRSMFIQFFLIQFVPITLSMVNCVVIQPTLKTRSPSSTCYWFICFIPIFLITLKEFQFYNLLLLIKSKFERVNGQLLKYSHDYQIQDFVHPKRRLRLTRQVESLCETPLSIFDKEDIPVEKTWRTPTVEDMQSLLGIYSSIADTVDLVLRIFAWHLVLSTTISFGIITIQLYNVFAIIMHSLVLEIYEIGFIVAWILVQIIVIFINVNGCSMISDTMSATGPLVHKIRFLGDSELTCIYYQIIQTFSMEVMHRKHSMSAAGLFNMDPKLITSIIAAATTYLVIIIQFHLTNIGNLCKNNDTLSQNEDELLTG